MIEIMYFLHIFLPLLMYGRIPQSVPHNLQNYPVHQNSIQIDLDQLFDENDEDNEVQISLDRELNASPDANLEKQADVFIYSSEDEDEYVPQGVTETSDNPETPRNISPQLYPPNISEDPPILQPHQIKLENEAEISLPQGGSTSTNNNTVLSLVNANVKSHSR